ncbi:hypothetical protein UR09_01270 [Candidatus Nitromaritima sp. SCGC AAA799-A02]|nr:hypothetical protein UZ36_04045 [Candidatus Nitromaritima sp. SCGC AAA799-C22]KMP12390.1 hypothetical protein UR09_01270 [Candidatus Nitromaritima sp. SCGC AAA799-A02]
MSLLKSRESFLNPLQPNDDPSLFKERFLSTEGPIHLTGIQALVRLPFDNLRFLKAIYPDKKFAYFISGYEGSPLGGLDILLKRAYSVLREWDIVHIPGGNEEAAANMMWGSQLHRLFGPAKIDGIIGAWYGKGPGVRRMSDVEDHLQMTGLDKLCAAYFMSGDDHSSKSSTTPHQTDLVHFANHVPTAFPGNIQEILTIGKRATLASMISGLSVNLKLETYVCDGSQEFILNPDEDQELAEQYFKFIKEHHDYTRFFSTVLLKPKVLKNEEELFYSKLPMIQEISREFGFDAWHNRNLKSEFGVVATGKSYFDLLGALTQLNISVEEIEIYKPMFTWPPAVQSFREFARGKKEIIVIEEKQAFYESHIKNEFFNETNRPVIVGKTDECGETLFRQNSNLDADLIAEVLGKRLVGKEQFKGRGIRRFLEGLKKADDVISSIEVKRPPEYCSGCQHRTALEIPGYDNARGTFESLMVETKDLDGHPVQVEITPKHVMGIGIGCSTMSIIDTLASNRAVVVGPMGSEGLLWMGASTFAYRTHVHQGCGDGTFFHSAENNIRFIRDAIKHLKTYYDIDDTHQTLLIVDNEVVAMTGGQRPMGQDDPATIVTHIKKEGIENIAIIAEFPEHFYHLRKEFGIEVYHKSDTLRVKEKYSRKPGLSVIWYVQKCGLEKSRERRAHHDLAPKMRLHVNQEVCENCGDCGLEAKCASVWKTDTEFGPKVKIHQYSCIQDYACANGECPSYVKVYSKSGNPLKKPDLEKIAIKDDELEGPERELDPNKIFKIYSIGIGGWGLMTAYEILARAATKEGRNVVKEDDTGLSQKGGEVRNSLKVSDANKILNEGFKIEAGGADLYISADLIGAVNPENLKEASREKTRAIINTEKVPTMPMIVGKAEYPELKKLRQDIDAHTIKEKNIYVNATEIVETLFKDFKPTQIFLLGVAFQSVKDFPVEHARNIEDAIRVNNIEVEVNIQAFRYGRLYAIDPDRVLKLARPKKPGLEERINEFKEKLGKGTDNLYVRLFDTVDFGDEYQGKFVRQIYELIRFQNIKCAGEFVNFIGKVFEIDKERFPNKDFRLAKSVADSLYDVMAYKDEYRVADLLTRPEAIQEITDQYEEGEIQKIRFLLRPPVLAQIPWIKDIKYIKDKFDKDEKWEVPRFCLDILKHFKWVRGTPLDFMGYYSEIRKLEREEAVKYKQRVDQLLNQLDEKNYAAACEAASYPSLARGYDKVKKMHKERAEDFWREKIAEITLMNGNSHSIASRTRQPETSPAESLSLAKGNS